MARQRKLHIGMLNVVTHPHSPSSYVDLFKIALNFPVKMGGDHRAVVGTWSPIVKDDPIDGIQGYIFRYTELDMDGAWLDMVTRKKIEPEELEELVSVPENFKPGFSSIWFNFYPKTHRLVFEVETKDYTTGKASSFSQSTAQLFFQRLFNRIKDKTRFSSIDVTIVQSHETLRKIFSLPSLQSLEIVINRPNPTDGTFEEQIERQLQEEKTTHFEQLMVSKEMGGLKPSSRTQALAKVAMSNGYVEAKGKEATGQKVVLKTIEKPVELITSYDPKQGLAYAFLEAAKKLIAAYRSD